MTGVAGDAMHRDRPGRVLGFRRPKRRNSRSTRTSVELVERDGAWVLETRLGSERGTRVDVELNVPHGFSVTVSTASGDLWLENLTGSQNVKTMSGDVNVASLGSGVGDRSSCQHEERRCDRSVARRRRRAQQPLGRRRRKRLLRCSARHTQSGDVRVTDGRGTLQAKTMSGDVHAELVDFPCQATSRSGSPRSAATRGSRTGQSASLDVEAKSTSGDADVALDLDDAQRGEHRVTGTYNGGRVRDRALERIRRRADLRRVG